MIDLSGNNGDRQPKLLGAANQWERPDPGPPVVFLSYHSEDVLQAIHWCKALRKAGVTVKIYNPNNRWPDGPMEMLRAIVTLCHCIVYVGPRRKRSKFVRFELRIAREFQISVIRIRSDRQMVRGLVRINDEAKKKPRYDPLRGLSVSRAISNACKELDVEDIVSSDANYAGRTGLDLMSRSFDRRMEDIGRDIRFIKRAKFVLKAFPIFVVLVLAALLILYFFD